MALAVVQECAAIAEANGYPPPETLVAEHSRVMTEQDSELTSSMYRALTRGGPIEADHILGDLLDHARHVSTPLLAAAYVQLKVYEAGRA